MPKKKMESKSRLEEMIRQKAALDKQIVIAKKSSAREKVTQELVKARSAMKKQEVQYDKATKAYYKALKRHSAVVHGRPKGSGWCDRCDRWSVVEKDGVYECDHSSSVTNAEVH